MDLEGRVARQESVARVGLPDLPEHLAVERHRRQAAALHEVAAVDLGDHLGEDHLGDAVAIEVAEAHVAAGAVVRGLELLPELRLRILLAESCQFRVARLNAGLDTMMRSTTALERRLHLRSTILPGPRGRHQSSYGRALSRPN